MKSKAFLATVLVMLVLALTLPSAAPAEVVGRLSQVDGQVDLLKGGKLPAIPLKLGDSVESGDVLRSKSLSKAQITFMDNSIITLSPESRLTIEDYQFEPGQHRRNAVLQLFQGLVHVVVNKLYKVEEPDFIVKTQTAITGVRGTDFGVRIAPNSSTILNFAGKTRVASSFPEVGAWLKRAGKIAYGPNSGHSFFHPGHFVDLGNMQGTEVQRGLPPTLPFSISDQDRQRFMRQMSGGLLGRRGTSAGRGSAVIGLASLSETMSQTHATSSVPDVAPLGLVTGTGSAALTLVSAVTIPPTVIPTPSPAPTPTPTPTPGTFTFTQQYYAAFVQMADAPYSQSSLAASSWGQRTGVYAGYFYGSTAATYNAASGTTFSPLATGTSIGTATGTVTGILGQTLTGTMTYTGTSSAGSAISRTGTVTLLPTGQLTYNWTDTVKVGDVTTATGVGTSTQTPGTYFSQTASGNFTTTANPAGSQSTSTNAGDIIGTRTMAGITTSFRAGFSVTDTKPTAGSFPPSDSGTISINSQGVLGAPDATGARTGVMTNTALTSTSTTPDTSGGPITYVPASGSAPAAIFAQIISETSGRGRTRIGMWAQTADTDAIIKTQTYEGSHTITPPGSSTGILSGVGWGIRMEPSGTASSLATPTAGNLTATVTDASGQPLGSNLLLNQTLAAVVNPNATSSFAIGPAQGIGVANNNGIVSTSGAVRIDVVSGILTNTFTGTFVSPSGDRGIITGGTQTLTPGELFTQTATGNLLSTSSGPNYQVQTTTNPAALTGDRSGYTPVVPGIFAISPNNLSITNTAGAPNAFTPSVSTNALMQSQGVIVTSGLGGSGAMTVTLQNASVPGGSVATAMGPVSITSTGALAANSLVGKNIILSPSGPAIPATQSGTLFQGPIAH